MHVLLAGSRVGVGDRALPARRALAALGAGWAEANPAAQLDQVPCSDGEADLLDAIESAHGGTREVAAVLDAHGRHAHPVVMLLVAGTGYVQAADVLPGAPRIGVDRSSGGLATAAADLGFIDPTVADPAVADLALAETGSSYGVGQLVAAALDAGAHRVIVGAGTSATLDLGTGLLRGLVGDPFRPFSPDIELAELAGLLDRARRRLGPAEIVLAAASTTAVRGLRGAAAALQLTLGREAGQRLDARIAPLADALGAAAGRARRSDLLAGPGSSAAVAPVRASFDAGAGVGGGSGAAVAAVGGRVVPGAAFVAAEIDLPARMAGVDLAVVLSDRIDAVEADSGVLGAVSTAAAREGVAVLGLGRTGRLERRAAAPYGIAATALVEPGVAGLVVAGRRQGAAWRW